MWHLVQQQHTSTCRFVFRSDCHLCYIRHVLSSHDIVWLHHWYDVLLPAIISRTS